MRQTGCFKNELFLQQIRTRLVCVFIYARRRITVNTISVRRRGLDESGERQRPTTRVYSWMNGRFVPLLMMSTSYVAVCRTSRPFKATLFFHLDFQKENGWHRSLCWSFLSLFFIYFFSVCLLRRSNIWLLVVVVVVVSAVEPGFLVLHQHTNCHHSVCFPPSFHLLLLLFFLFCQKRI